MSAAPLTRTRAELVASGRDPCSGDHLVRRGVWVRAAPSTYLLPGAALGDRVRAALQHAGTDGVVTGWAACALLGLPYVVDAGAVPVLVPARRRRTSTPYVQVMPTTRPPAWWLADDLRVAAPARAVVDAARALGRLSDVRALVLGAQRLVAVEDLQRELTAGSRGGRLLVARTLRDAHAGAASCPEAEACDAAAELVRAGRLPPFLLNPDVYVDGVLVGRRTAGCWGWPWAGRWTPGSTTPGKTCSSRRWSARTASSPAACPCCT